MHNQSWCELSRLEATIRIANNQQLLAIVDMEEGERPELTF